MFYGGQRGIEVSFLRYLTEEGAAFSPDGRFLLYPPRCAPVLSSSSNVHSYSIAVCILCIADTHTIFISSSSFAASGSHDTTVKVLDTAKMYQFGTSSDRRDFDVSRPVIRTLYDHSAAVNCVAFHPTMAYLFSGSADKTIKVYDLTKPSTQLRALSSISDSSVVQSMAVGCRVFRIPA